MNDLFQLVGTSLEGKYAITEVVAEGGFGVVYKARHQTLDKDVAVKVLKVPDNLQGNLRVAFLDAFAREARTIAKLEHPSIVRVIDFGATRMPTGDSAPWMVLEWLSGSPLESDLEARRGAGGRTPLACLAMLRPVFEALALAHEEGIAHRDIKPANLMVLARPTSARSTGPRRGEAALKVMDFGIAKVMQPEETSASGMTRTRALLVAFSLPYAAPEQVSGTRTGPWTDVHALGLILTEVLVDAAPYRGSEVMDLHLEVVSLQRPTPARFGVEVGAWEPVIARALALRPGDRFGTAGEFLAALEATLEHATHGRVGETAPLAQPPRRVFTTLHPAERRAATPPPRRGRLALALAGIAALGAMTGGVIAVAARSSLERDTHALAPVRRVEMQAPPAPVAAAPAPAAPAPAAPAPAAPAQRSDTPSEVNARGVRESSSGREHRAPAPRRAERAERAMRPARPMVPMMAPLVVPVATPGRIHAE